MYKSKLQELCQRQRWELPKYSTVKDGPQHLPRFTATVNVNGQLFHTPAFCTSSKEAHNSAAQIAFHHLNTPPPSPAVMVAPSPELLAVDPIAHHDTPHIYKSQLQRYTLRENLGYPVYAIACEGPPHNCHFKSTVFVGGQSYQTLEFFPSQKEAERAAAKVACQALSVNITKEAKDVLGLYKNLLQQIAKKKGLLVPSYETTSSGLPHNRVFVSTVEIGEYTFQGDEAKTKKQAEMFAAGLAYCFLANDDNLHAKRAKPSTESMNVHTPSPSNAKTSSVETNEALALATAAQRKVQGD